MTVNQRLTAELTIATWPGDAPNSGPKVENGAYSTFVRRIIRAHARRVADGDVEGLAEMARLRDEVGQALVDAVAGLRAEPWSYSWTEIGRALGITRQAAQQRYGRGTMGRTTDEQEPACTTSRIPT